MIDKTGRTECANGFPHLLELSSMMIDQIRKPSGYCPHCEYPIDPGICSECGADVTPETLASRPPSLRRRRVVRRTVLVGALCIALILGAFLSHRVQWIRWVPADVLLLFQGDFNSTSSMELRRRFGSNQLTYQQLQKILKHFIVDPVLECSRQYPGALPIEISIKDQYRNNLFAGFPWKPSMGDIKFRVDGTLVQLLNDQDIKDGYGFFRYKRDTIWCPPLDEGKHEISLESDFHFKWSHQKSKTVTYKLHARITDEIEIRGDVFDYVRMTRSPSTVRRMRSSIKAYFYRRSPKNPRLGFFHVSALPAPVAGVVLVRNKLIEGGGETAFVLMGKIFLSKDPYSRWGFNLRTSPSIDDVQRIDIRIIPDASIAYFNHAKRCFDGELIWEGVTASDTRPFVRHAVTDVIVK